MNGVPPSVQPHLLAHSQAMKAFGDSLETDATLRQQAKILFDASKAAEDAGIALLREADSRDPAKPRGSST